MKLYIFSSENSSSFARLSSSSLVKWHNQTWSTKVTVTSVTHFIKPFIFGTVHIIVIVIVIVSKVFPLVDKMHRSEGGRTKKKVFGRNKFSFFYEETPSKFSCVSQTLHLNQMYDVLHSYFVRISLTKCCTCRIILT